MEEFYRAIYNEGYIEEQIILIQSHVRAHLARKRVNSMRANKEALEGDLDDDYLDVGPTHSMAYSAYRQVSNLQSTRLFI